jgi:hypothetical protein
MSFIQPYLLLGLPLFLIPVLIHLLNRLRYKSVAWAAVMFIMKATKSSTSMAKIRQWLILLLRMLAVAALILAVSRPVMSGWLGWKLSGTPDSVIVLLDRSAGMGCRAGGAENMLQKGIDLITDSGLKTASGSKIIVIDSLNLKPELVPDWSVLKYLPVSEVTQASADFPAMFRKALDYLLKNPGGLTEIWCVSDMESGSWVPDSPEWEEINEKIKALPVPVIIKILALRSGKNNNRSIHFRKILHYSTESDMNIYEAVFSVRQNSALAESEIPVTLSVNNINTQKSIKVSGGDSLIRIRLPDPEKNRISIGAVKIPDDINLYDNTCYFAYGEPLKGKVIIQTDSSYLSALLTAAVFPVGESSDAQILKPETDLTSSLLKGAALYISNIPFPSGPNEEKVFEYLNSGGIALFFPPAGNNSGNRESKFIWNSRVEEFSSDNVMTVTVWDHKEGIFADSVSGAQLPLSSLNIYKRVLLLKGDIKPYALCADGRPFFYKKLFSGKGTLYFCTTLPLDTWSNFGGGPVLVPVLKRMRGAGSERFSEIVYAECGKMTFKSESDGLQKVYSAENKESDITGTGGAGVYFYKNKYVVLNRAEKSLSSSFLSDKEADDLLKDKKIYLFSQKVENDSALQAEIWRWFLVISFCFLIAESFMLAPKKEDSP